MILLSWDGTRWDYPDRVELPALERMAREGVRAERLIPVFPSSTFPSHVALATGTWVDRHGIVASVFRDPERGRYAYSDDAGFIEAEPVWVAAERQGVRAASFFWVGSETDWSGVGASHRIAPFDDSIPESRKVDQILAWLDLPAPERPRLILSWWRGADGVGHRYGPRHPQIAEALREQDRELARLLAGLDARDAWRDTTLILVSDHGMALSGEPIEVIEPLRARGIEAEVTPGGGFAYLHLADASRRSEAVEVLDAVDGLRAYAGPDLPERLRAFHPTRSGDVILIAEAPRSLWRSSGLLASAWVWFRSLVGGESGLHGFDPENPDMHAVFFALGRGVSPTLELGPVRAIDVAPTVTSLLGIDPPRDAEGRPVDGIGTDAPPLSGGAAP